MVRQGSSDRFEAEGTIASMFGEKIGDMMRFGVFKLGTGAWAKFRAVPLASRTTGNSETTRFGEPENEQSGDANGQVHKQQNTHSTPHTNVWASWHGSSKRTTAERNT